MSDKLSNLADQICDILTILKLVQPRSVHDNTVIECLETLSAVTWANSSKIMSSETKLATTERLLVTLSDDLERILYKRSSFLDRIRVYLGL